MYEIQKIERKERDNDRFPFRKLEIGDGFKVIDVNIYQQVRNAAWRYNAKYKTNIRCIKQADGSLQVYRDSPIVGKAEQHPTIAEFKAYLGSMTEGQSFTMKTQQDRFDIFRQWTSEVSNALDRSYVAVELNAGELTITRAKVTL